jgi:hypothetical protein
LDAETNQWAHPLVELFDPPAGYYLKAGFLVTYDLSVTALVETVLARLAGAQPHERLETGLEGPTLTVAYERLHTGAMIPSWNVELVRCPSSDGRPLHAKGGLLHFQPVNGQRRSLLRGWVGSANLTAGGLQRNRELILAGECGPGQTNLAVSQAMQLCDAVADTTGSLAKRRLAWVAPTAQRRRRSGVSLLHSIGEDRGLLADAHRVVPEGLHRLDIVTPTYQSKGSGRDIAEQLQPILPPPGGEVHVYTSTDLEDIQEGDHHVTAFPTSLTDALRDLHGLEVIAHFLPEVVDGQRRRLHAKAYILHGDTEAVVLVGSANTTRSGLGGKNREALAIHRLETSAAREWLDRHLTDHCWTDLDHDEGRLRSVEVDAETGDDLVATTYAELAIADDTKIGADGRWVGQLILHRLPPGRQLTVRVGERSVTATVGHDGMIDVSAHLDGEPFALLPHEGSVKIEDEHGNHHEVVVFAHASQDWFKAAIEQRDRPPRPRSAREVHELERLLATLQRFQQPTSSAPTPPAGGHAGPDDRLVLPLDRRFDLVAKFAAHYPLATDEEIRRYLEAEENDPRYEVVRAIRTARTGGTDDPLLRQLQEAVRATTRGSA